MGMWGMVLPQKRWVVMLWMFTPGVDGRLTLPPHKLVEYLALSTDRVIRSTISSAASHRTDNASACFGQDEENYLIQLVSSHLHSTIASPHGGENGVHDDGGISAKVTNLEAIWRTHEVRDGVLKNHVYILMDSP